MATGFEDWSTHAFTSASEEEQEIASATATETIITFSSEVKSWTLYNDGANAVHYSLSTGVTTDNFKIPPRAGIVRDVVTTKIYLVCATGETATVYAAGYR